MIEELENAVDLTTDLCNAALGMQQVADHIKSAVGAPFRPAWADPTITVLDLGNKHRLLLKRAADRIRDLEARLAAR